MTVQQPLRTLLAGALDLVIDWKHVPISLAEGALPHPQRRADRKITGRNILNPLAGRAHPHPRQRADWNMDSKNISAPLAERPQHGTYKMLTHNCLIDRNWTSTLPVESLHRIPNKMPAHNAQRRRNGLDITSNRSTSQSQEDANTQPPEPGDLG